MKFHFSNRPCLITLALFTVTISSLSALADPAPFAVPSTVPMTQVSSRLADDLMGSLYTMRAVYRAEYAPADWKKAYSGYDLDVEFAKAMAAVSANPNLTLTQAHRILKNFIYSMKDYHTSISFISTEAASLPLIIKGTDSRFFIVYIDRAKLPANSFPFEIGDEVVTFDGYATADAVAAVQAETPENVPSTDKSLAEISLTSRRGTKGLKIPHGPITLGIKAEGSSSVQDFQLIWDYSPETIKPREDLTRGQEPKSLGAGFSGSNLFHAKMNVQTDTPVTSPYGLGSRKTFTPELGTKIWESTGDNEFYAYIYKNSGNKLIGYLRLPSYEASDYIKATSDFEKIISLFEASTDSMIIDQVNNPGGSVFYLYALASMLTAQPLQTPLHRMAITQAEVAEAQMQIAKLSAVHNDEDAKAVIPPTETAGYPVSYEFARFRLSYASFIVSEWNAGHKLTQPYWIDGVEHINPAATHYSKPIVVLINHLDFSGGDFFPTIMQDNKRVTVFGSRTAGAGGYVNDVSVPNNLGIDSFRCTESIAERVNLSPIENLGVTPDVPYSMSANDFQNNYVDYVKAIQATVSSVTP